MNQRFYSLDVFRGATVALMILVNNPGSWGHIYDPLEHATWHGCTPTDLVFPFFLFAVGNAMAFVMPRLEAQGDKAFWMKLVKRSLLIFSIGVLLNWFPFIKYSGDELVGKPFSMVRIFGVLQRIALCYFFAGIIIYYCKIRGAFLASAILLLLYWFICLALNPSDPYSLAGWFGTRIDLALLGPSHMYRGEGIPFDPEGPASLMGAIPQVIFGYLAGHYILKKGKTHEMVNGLFVSGCVLVFAGFFWDMFFPINKKIWTSSYTVYTSGLAMIILALLIYMVEFRNWKGRVSKFFDVFGKNPLFIFVLSGALPRLLALIRIPSGMATDGRQLYITPLGWLYKNICKPLFSDERNASLLYAICFVVLMWLIGWWMDKKKWHVKV